MGVEDVNVDELLEGIESPAAERPMTGGVAPDQPPAEAAAPDPNAWRKDFAWEFDWNGQKVSPDSAEKAKTWLSLGHNYNQRAAELNRERAAWQKEREELTTKYKGFDRYAEFDQYARQNPQWWQHVEQQWNQRGQQGVDPSLQPLLDRLQKAETFIEQQQRLKAEQTQREQDQALDAEISEIRKQYPNIDLSSVDETGKPLEYRILAHANEHGINSFRAAFRDYLHDRLVEESKAQGLAQQAKDKELAAKKGLLGTTQAPTKGLKPASNVRGKSYGDLASEALQEFGIQS